MKKKIEVVLMTNIPSLGLSGEVRTVSFSYAKNFLFPKGLAVIAETNTLKRLHAQKEHLEHAARMQDADAAQRAQQLASVVLQLRMPANDKGVLYGGVHAEDICTAAAEAGVPGIQPKMVTLLSPMERVGEYRVALRLGQRKVDVRVRVDADRSADHKHKSHETL